MKFYPESSDLFSDVKDQLDQENSSVSVVHLNYWEEAKKVVKNHWIMVEESLEPRELITEFYTKDITHFVQKSGFHFAQDLRKTGGLIENPSDYFQSLYSFIEPSNLPSLHFQFSKPEDKAPLMDKVCEYVDQLPSAFAKEAAIAAVEELYMNAVLDAPREYQKLGLPQRDTPCEIYFSRNDHTLQISCTDPYGSLSLKKLFGRMYEVYQKGAGEAINLKGTGGAGIGCFLLLEKCRSLFFGVQKGVRTKVTCLIPLSRSFREQAKIKKSIHGFEVEK